MSSSFNPDARKPRILFIQTQAENAGAQQISRLLGEELAPRGYDVHHLFMYRKTDAFDGMQNTVFSADQRPGNPIALIGFLARMVRQVRAIQPDVVLTFQHYGNLFGAPVARLAGVRHVIANQVSARATMNGVIRLLDRVYGTVGMYDEITVNSHDMAREYADCSESYRKRLHYVPHGFREKRSSLTKQQARMKFGLPQDAVLLGSVARLNALKRLDVAVRLLPHEKSWHLVLGGFGPAEASLRALASELGVADRCHFTGELSSDAVGDLLAAMDVFVFPSEAETFGLAPVEAAETGLPVVCNGIPVLREVLTIPEGPCALFADSDEPESFLSPIRKILSGEQEVAGINEASRKLGNVYSIRAMVDQYDKLIAKQAYG